MVDQRVAEKWKKYWADKTMPDHTYETPEFYSLHVRELKVLFGEELPIRVLEIGCGNGALYPYYGFQPETYRGVDFSPSMLAVFRAKHPEVQLECCEGSSYVDRENKYDLIFSNQLVQNFDLPMLGKHFSCARTMMHKDSLLVCGSIPWRIHRMNFYMGLYGGHFKRPKGLFQGAKRKVWVVWVAFCDDPMGRWFEMDEIKSLADHHGFSVEFYGSLAYPYRFHAVMRMK